MKRAFISSSTAPFRAVLFPGQGAQKVGMVNAHLASPSVQNMFSQANDVLGFDLRALCIDGPQTTLDHTVHAQPAMLMAGLAAQADRGSPDDVAFTAGLSLGEYSALVYAEAISLQDALQVVKIRAEAMQEASDAVSSGMTVVVGMDDHLLQQLCSEVRGSTNDICEVAINLFPKGRVVAGHSRALKQLSALIRKKGIRTKDLAVSGAFHTSLMRPAIRRLEMALRDVTLHQPRFAVVSNITGAPYESADCIREGLVRQLCEPVQWERSLRHIADRQAALGHVPEFDIGVSQELASPLTRTVPGCVLRTHTN